jgi:hypothetical protein
MAQWFKSLKLWLLKFLNVAPTNVALDIHMTEERIKRSALTLHTYHKDEAMVAMTELLRAEQTRLLFSLASFDGTLEKLHKVQGRLEAIGGLLSFIKEAGALSAPEVKTLRQQRQKEATSRVLKFGSNKPQDVVI